MKTTMVTGASALLFTLVAAMPSHLNAPHHEHLHHHAKRELISSTKTVTNVVMETVTDIVTVTLEPGQQAPGASPTSSSAQQGGYNPPPSSSPASVAQPLSSEPYVPPPQSTPSSSSTSSTSTSTTSSSPPPPPSPTSPTNQGGNQGGYGSGNQGGNGGSSSGGSGGSSGGRCASGNPCSGDITHYDPGLGACGETSTANDPVVALPHGLMGTQSNGNPFCGKNIHLSYNGKTAKAKVVDKCMGCEGDSVDLSDAVYSQLDALGNGRAHGVKWWFTD